MQDFIGYVRTMCGNSTNFCFTCIFPKKIHADLCLICVFFNVCEFVT